MVKKSFFSVISIFFFFFNTEGKYWLLIEYELQI